MTSKATTSPAALAGELVLTRVLQAPRELVWRCRTEPERFGRRFGRQANPFPYPFAYPFPQ